MDNVSDPPRPAIDTTNWTLVVRTVSPSLAPYVLNISGYVEHLRENPSQHQLPTTFIPMILVLDSGFSTVDEQAGRRPISGSFIAGLQDASVTMQSSGFAVCMQVDFTIAGARRFLGIDMHELTGRIETLDDVMGSFANRLVQQLSGFNSWQERFDYLEQQLTQRLLERPKASADMSPTTLAALQAMNNNHHLSVSKIAEDLGVSRKHLAHLFSKEVGISPKQFTQLRRFEAASDKMSKNTKLSLADLALHFGYSDQAHFSRQFRHYVGTSPSEYLANLDDE